MFLKMAIKKIIHVYFNYRISVIVVSIIGFLLFQSCDSTKGDSVINSHMSPFHQSLEAVSSDLQDLKKRYEKMSKPQLPLPLGIFSNNEWQYAVGSPSEQLFVDESSLPQQLQQITLQHRILEPNRSLWYLKEALFLQDVTLQVSADDGAQVWYNNERIPLYRGRYFNIPSSEQSGKLVIRVLNNAMRGGLNSVYAYSQQEFMEYEEYRKLYRRIEILIKKTINLGNPPHEAILKIQQAIDNVTENHVSKAEEVLADYSYFVTPPYLQQTDLTSLSILWQTDLITEYELIWGEEPTSMNNSVISDSASIIHEAKLFNLKPGKTYYYQIEQGKSRSEIHPFKLPADTTHFDFAIWGDSQSGWDTFDQVVRAMQAHPIEFSVGVGDLADQAWRPLQYTQLLKTLYPISAHTPVFMVPGNHDYDGFYDTMVADNYHQYARNGQENQRTYYSWRSGNTAFIALDPHVTFPVGIEESSEQYKWLIDELNKPFWREAAWHFIVLHHPPYAQGWPGYHGEISVREVLEPLIEEYEIDFVVTGHSHAYERLIKQYGDQTTYYIVTGGAGGNLSEALLSDYPRMDKVIFDHHYTHWQVRGDTIFFNALDNDRKSLDQLMITK